jgi:hypothetical protein
MSYASGRRSPIRAPSIEGHDGDGSKPAAPPQHDKGDDMSSKVSSGRNHNHSDSKQSGQQAPGSTPPGARSGASQQSDAARQSQKSESGSKQSESKSDKS